MLSQKSFSSTQGDCFIIHIYQYNIKTIHHENTSNHIQESFKPVPEEQQTVIESQIDNKEEIVNEDESVEKEKRSGGADGL